MSKVNVAVVGVTGAVGEVMLEILESRDFPVDTLYPLASARSAGKSVQFRGKRHVVQDLSEFDFSQTQIALFSAGGDISAEFAPIAASAGCVVIDNTSHFRRDDDIPLVIPEVNPQAISHTSIEASLPTPNCSTIGMLVALKQSMMLLASIELTWRPTKQSVAPARPRSRNSQVRRHDC
ncbi:MAG: hypothetical protein CM15mP84_09180 [Cellvibrionales bacterium]|nr:MAG: hypothetical protein CM15mP84_09180 [Cellvibrionales bacterium]